MTIFEGQLYNNVVAITIELMFVLTLCPGARKCIGYAMSEMQLFLYVTHILRHFTLRPPAGKKTVNTETHMRIARRLKDFRCVLEPRDHSNQSS